MGNVPQNLQQTATAVQQTATAAQQTATAAQQATTAAQQATTAAQQTATAAQQAPATASQDLLTQVLQALLRQLQNQAPKPFEAKAKNAVDTYKDIVAGLKFKTLPNSPTLTATAMPPTGIELTWIDSPDNADGYKIRRKDGSQLFMVINELDSSARSFTDTNLTSNIMYDYELVAHNIRGEAVPSGASAIAP